MTNGPNETSTNPNILDNPYPRGSARWKLKKRQLDARRKKARDAADKRKPEVKEDKSKRRKYLDEQIDG